MTPDQNAAIEPEPGAAGRAGERRRSAPQSPRAWRGVVLRGLIVGAAVLLIYGPALRGDWLWDDEREVGRNPVLRDSAGLAKIWLGEGALDYYPLKASAQWLLWQVWGDSRVGWHTANIGLHLGGALLLWRLLRRLGLGEGAWFGGLIFAIHPVAVGSVAWIAEFKNVLSLPFALLSFLAFVDYDERGRTRDAWRALLLFVAALLCKTSVIMLPVVLGLYLWWKYGGFPRRRWLALAPFFGVALVLGLVTIMFQHQRAIGSAEIPAGGLDVRFARAGLALVFYAGKAVWPFELMPVYPRWPVDPPAAWMFLPWVGVAVVFAWLWSGRKSRGRGVLFGAGTFLALLLPVLGFVAMAYMHVAWVADHLMYPALPALAALAGAGLDVALTRLPAGWRTTVVAVAAVAVGLWIVVARVHAANFRDARALWSYAVNRNATSALAWTNLGNTFFSAGHAKEAARHFLTAVRCDPNDVGARINLGNALSRLGRVDDAIREHERAVQLAPASAVAANSLGGSLLDANRLADARRQLERALQLEPNHAEAHNNLGIVFARSGDEAGAALHFETALNLDPNLASARANLETLRGSSRRR